MASDFSALKGISGGMQSSGSTIENHPRFCPLAVLSKSVLLVVVLCSVLGCGSATPPAIPEELKPFVTDSLHAPFSVKSSAPSYSANLASDRSMNSEKAKALIEKIAEFGYVSHLVVRVEGDELSALPKLNKFQGLHLSFAPGAAQKTIDLRFLSQFENLQELSMGYEAGVQLGGAVIAVPPSVVHLNLYQLPVKAIEGLENCKGLKELDISINPLLEDVSAFGGLPSLSKLRIDESTLTKLSKQKIAVKTDSIEILDSKSLAETVVGAGNVAVYGNRTLTKLDGVEAWQGVQVLKLNYLQALQDLSALNRMTSLRQLTLTQCQLNEKPVVAEDLQAFKNANPQCSVVID